MTQSIGLQFLVFGQTWNIKDYAVQGFAIRRGVWLLLKIGWKCCIKNTHIKVVIPAVLKRESRNKGTGCPIENLGHDEKYSSQELTPGELLRLTLVLLQIRFWLAFADFY
jgi:hypothetical protein